MNTVMLEEMTWPEIRDALAAGMRTVVIMTSSIEQHGPHLAENTDTVLGANAAAELARRLGNALVAPVIRPALSAHHMALPGSVALRPETFKAVLEDYVSSYVQHGFDTILILSSHGGNDSAVMRIAEELGVRYPEVRIVGLSQLPSDAEKEEFGSIHGLPEGSCNGHADDRETSAMLFLAPQNVRMDVARPGFTGKLTPETLGRFTNEGVTSLSDIGVVGDPCHATPARGAWYVKFLSDKLERAVREQLGEVPAQP